jgi:hypothetical protein
VQENEISYRESGSNPNTREYFLPQGSQDKLVEAGFVEFTLPLPRSWDADKAFSVYPHLTEKGKQVIIELSNGARSKGYFEKVILRSDSVQLRRTGAYNWNQVESTIAADVFSKAIGIEGDIEFLPSVHTIAPALEMAGAHSR